MSSRPDATRTLPEARHASIRTLSCTVLLFCVTLTRSPSPTPTLAATSLESAANLARFASAVLCKLRRTANKRIPQRTGELHPRARCPATLQQPHLDATDQIVELGRHMRLQTAAMPARLVRCLLLKRQTKSLPKHPQDCPHGPRFAGKRFDHAVERLHALPCSTKVPAASVERRDRQTLHRPRHPEAPRYESQGRRNRPALTAAIGMATDRSNRPAPCPSTGNLLRGLAPCLARRIRRHLRPGTYRSRNGAVGGFRQGIRACPSSSGAAISCAST